ncbi:hypothetical protein CR513_62936, partial [Mucuna pruriens]
MEEGAHQIETSTTNVATIGEHGHPSPKSLVICYNPTSQARVPLVILLLEPQYINNHTVPLKYPQEEMTPRPNENKEITSIARIGGIIQSGQIYAQRSCGKRTTSKTRKKEKWKNHKMFLKKRRRANSSSSSETTLMRISLLSLLVNLEGHRQLLLKVLNEAHVTKDISVEKFGGIVGSLTTTNHISFSRDEVPEGGRNHNLPLHIAVRCGDYVMARVLIDNGSSLNIMPKTTLLKLCSIGA